MSYTLEEEVRDLQMIYGTLCRVKMAVPEGFKATVDIRKQDKTLNINFKVPASYPSVPPSVYASSTSIGGELKDELNQQLNKSAERLRGTSMMALIVEEAYQWCLEKNIYLGPAVCPP